MDLHLVLALNMMVVSAVSGAIALVYRPAGYAWWLFVNGLVLVVGALALYGWPDRAAWFVAVVFVPLVALPMLLTSLAVRAERRGHHNLADRLNRIGMLLHPSADARLQTRVGEALSHPTTVGVTDALLTLRREANSGQRALIDTFLAAEQDDWNGVLTATRDRAAPPYELKATEIRALGELGRIDEMAALYEQVKTRLLGAHMANAQLFLFAFAGKPERVEDLLKGSLATLPLEGKIYWRAIARRAAAPDDSFAQSALENLATNAQRERTRLAARRQLAFGMPHVTTATREIVESASRRLGRDAGARARPAGQLYVTLTLIAACLVMAAVAHYQGGTEDFDTLYKLGALWPDAISDGGEWWRLIASAFLHFGPVHLAINMMMLFMLGRAVESRLGSPVMLAVYLWCALGSMTVVFWLMHMGLINEGLLVGASGAIFGLFGVIATQALTAWIKTRDKLDRSRLTAIGFILLLQAVMDVSIPNISFAGHASGFVMGVIAATVLAVWPSRSAP